MKVVISGEASLFLKGAAFAGLRRFFRDVCKIEPDYLDSFFQILDDSVLLAFQGKVSSLSFQFWRDKDRGEVFVVLQADRGFCFCPPPAQIFHEGNPFWLKRSSVKCGSSRLQLVLGCRGFPEEWPDIRNLKPHEVSR